MAEGAAASNAPIPVSVVVLCRNEAANLPRCLAAARACAETVLVDDGSDDGSPAVAAAAGARVVAHPMESFAAQRNWAMAEAGLRCDWALHLDADEALTPAALAEIRARLSALTPDRVGFIARRVMLDGRWLRRSADYPVFVARLVHRAGPRFVMRGHGETVEAPPETAVYFQEPMLHFPFSRGWDDWRARHRRYAAAEAARLAAGGSRAPWRDALSPDPARRRRAWRALSYRLPGRPLLRFLYGYFVRAGFLDGRPGFRFCRAMAWYEARIDAELRRHKRETPCA